MSGHNVVIYSSASGGTIVQKKTTEMVSTCQVLRGGRPVNVVWCDGHVSSETFTSGTANNATVDNYSGWFQKYCGYPYNTAVAPIQ